MAEPNIPLDACNKLKAQLAALAARADLDGPKYPATEVANLLNELVGKLDEIALFIQQDQSGEI